MAELPASVLPAISRAEPLKRADFEDFIFGAGTGAFQVEGGIDGYGRGASIWDTFLKQQHPDLVDEYKTACDNYHKYKEDVEIMKYMNLDSYRFSISWSRILPQGRWKGEDGSPDVRKINQIGVQFYTDLISQLKNNGIKPFVTLFHWDLPQALQDEYQGFLGDDKFVKDFRDYADLCFNLFGEDVEHWTTFNEPTLFVMRGYYKGDWAPGHKAFSTADMSEYKAMHNLLKAHAEVVQLYAKHEQGKAGNPNGKIGIVVPMSYPFPYEERNHECEKAAQRMLDYQLGWVVDVVLKGDYPNVMKNEVKNLPKFTKEEKEKFMAYPIDFLGLNYYTSVFVRPGPIGMCPISSRTSHPDTCVKTSYSRTRNYMIEFIGDESAGAGWLYVVPEGIKKLLDYVKKQYNNPLVYITENGYADKKPTTIFESMYDVRRVSYHHEHLSQIKKAKEEGCNVKGYFIWAFLDCLEWNDGSTCNFGVVHVTKEKERIPKLSAAWFKTLLANE